MSSLWNVQTGARIATSIEREAVNILLPLTNNNDTITEIISGRLPPGARLEGNVIVGTLFEVAYNQSFNVVIRAELDDLFEDRTVEIIVTGPDDPRWVTNSGLLPIGANDALFILDNVLVDFQLLATDTDLPAGDELSYYIANNDGELPPGIKLSNDGKLQGIVEPLLSLDLDFVTDSNDVTTTGFSSYVYDSVPYGFSATSIFSRKLNRYYPFAVTVTDGTSFIRREFKIYVVGDDFLTADNTLMQSSSGIFTADLTNIRTPTWLTPRDLGVRRANNYATIYLETIDNIQLDGELIYTLENVNQLGTISKLPPGLSLDSGTGTITGQIPYQPAITIDYTFTIRATRVSPDTGIVSIFANYFEDTPPGATSFKIFKIDRTGDIDGINDLLSLINREILLEERLYKVINVDDSNADYDVIFLGSPLTSSVPLILSRAAVISSDYLFVKRLSEINRQTYNQRQLRFEQNKAYTISSITPYIEYEITQTDLSITGIFPSGSPRDIQVGEDYIVGDYIVRSLSSGGNGFIYVCIAAHATEPQLDANGDIIFDNEGNVQLVFELNKWSEVAETSNDLSINDRVIATIQALEDTYNNKAFVIAQEPRRWVIRIPSTAGSRAVSNIRNFFGNNGTIVVKALRDNEDFVQLDKNLTVALAQGRNIGISLFARDFFSEDIVVAENDEVVIPSTAKTFNIQIIGEVDSNISWITAADLGTINANFTSIFKLEAETTVPFSKMTYKLVKGKLPFGMRLQYNGEIVGAPKQFADAEGLGLSIFDNDSVSWDGKIPGDTTFDRQYDFTVRAVDRFGIAAIERTFTVRVESFDNTQYTDIYARPMLQQSQRKAYRDFTSDPSIFTPDKIYRLGNATFGIQKNLDMLIYAGIEAKDIAEFVAAAAKNHKRTKYSLGEFKTAIAIDPDTEEQVYEVIYIDVNDFAQTDKGKTQSKFSIKNPKKITVDSLQYAAVDDNTNTGLGIDSLPVYGRGGFVRFIPSTLNQLIIETREGDVELSTDNADFEVELTDTSSVVVVLERTDSEPYRIRPNPTNTLKVDSNAILVSQSADVVKYRASIEHMRDNIKAIGQNERNYLPLWMRTPQNKLQELGYVSAIPVCYCVPGEAKNVLAAINNSNFNPNIINYDIDRYIVKRSKDSLEEKFILFANYLFNV